NKVWNAFRLISGFEVAEVPQSASAKAAIRWFEQRLSQQIALINEHYSAYKMSEALMATYKLVWDDFCAWYLEAIKPEFVDGQAQPIDQTTYDATLVFLEALLKLMHPWMPFLTEEIWHLLRTREEKDCVMLAEWPIILPTQDTKMLDDFEVAKELVTMVRNVRAQKQLSPKEKLEVIERSDAQQSAFTAVIKKLANLSDYRYAAEKAEGALSFVIRTTEYFIPLSASINKEEEKERLQKELDYQLGFLKSVQVKLSNERFVANAKPEIITSERKKESDAVAKITALEDQLRQL
ncbi:MAG: valine--tRNA ligase, partial [Sphingobacteriia bacterium]|nr:valine--tRNA ligase [Sphingobacteriia bacterium]